LVAKAADAVLTANDVAGQKLGLAGGAQAQDAFQNLLARTGAGSSSLENGTDYPLTRLTLNFWQLVSLFEGSWLARRIVEAPASDIVKTWPNVLGEIDPDDLAKFKRAVTKTNTRGKVLEALTWGRLFGGAGALIVVKGHEHELDKPLDLDKVGISSYRGLVTFDRWSGISPTGEVCDNFDNPLDVGLPEFYEIHAKNSSETFRAHSSRILRFCGPKMPEPENSVYQGWGISVLAPVMQALISYDNVSANALSLSYRANLIGMRMPELAQILSGVGISQKAAQDFATRMQPVNQMLSNQSLVMLPKDGELSNVQYSFGGLAELVQMFQLQMAGAAKMPVSLLWGRLYNGLGNAGDGDERIYEKTVATEADVTLRPALEKLFPVIMASELGEVPDDMELSFPSIRVLDEKEKTELAKTIVDTLTVVLNSGGISPRTYGKELKQSSDITGVFTNITDEDIEKLSDKVSSEGELGEGLFGPEGEGGGLNPASGPAKVIKEEDKQAKKLPGAVQGVKPVPVEGSGVLTPGGSTTEAPGAKKAVPRAKAEDASSIDTGRAKIAYLENLLEHARKVGDERKIDKLENELKLWKDFVAALAPSKRAKALDARPYTIEQIRALAIKPMAGKVQSKLVQNRVIRDLAEQGYFYWVNEAESAKELGCEKSEIDAANREADKYKALLNSAGAKALDTDGPARKTMTIHGLPVVIETRKGEKRGGTTPDGKSWSTVMPYDYGYFKGIPGADGDSLDIAVGPDPASNWVYIFDQSILGQPAKFDESKVLVHYSSQKAALNAFYGGHHRAKDVLLDWTPMHVDDFKKWLKNRDPKKPCSPEV
jgi:phage-related protein (TIGR01555 family)